MRAFVVVASQPGVDDLADLVQVFQQVCVQDFGPIGPVEALDVGVLVGLAGLNVTQLDAVIETPVDHRLGGILRSLVAANGLG